MAVSSIGSPAARHLARLLVQLEVLEHEPARLGRGLAGAAQDRADAGHELLEAERLGHVVVAAAAEPADLVLGGVARGQEDDRHAGALGAEAAGHLEALHVGQHHVEHHQVRFEAADRGAAPRGPVRGRLDREALEAQRHRDHLDDVRLVVDDEDPAPVGAVRRGRGRVTLGHGAPPGSRDLHVGRVAGAGAGRLGES